MRGNLNVYESEGNGTRGSGRTHRQLESLEDGDFYVVSSHAMRVWCNQLVRQHWPEKRINFVILDDVPNRLRGYSGWAEVDHAVVWELKEHQLDYIHRHNERVFTNG